MNAFQLLKEDHQKVSGIFEKLEPTTERALKTREEMLLKLKQELDIHAHVEETIFYPALKQALADKQIVTHALHEHQEVKDLLKQLETTPVDSEEWSATLLQLKESVEHHVDEEENKMFKQAREVLTDQQATELGERMAEEKKNMQPQAASA
ncbi:MAG TPA: hemerythrin domain-containing protein [Pyrinomonadaceae bacterium]|nr:hemerythrin domain-containing protein [Pyrinomonadaceae bacterium]